MRQHLKKRRPQNLPPLEIIAFELARASEQPAPEGMSLPRTRGPCMIAAQNPDPSGQIRI